MEVRWICRDAFFQTVNIYKYVQVIQSIQRKKLNKTLYFHYSIFNQSVHACHNSDCPGAEYQVIKLHTVEHKQTCIHYYINVQVCEQQGNKARTFLFMSRNLIFSFTLLHTLILCVLVKQLPKSIMVL